MLSILAVIKVILDKAQTGLQVFVHRVPESERPDNYILVRLPACKTVHEMPGFAGRIRRVEGAVELQFRGRLKAGNDQMIALMCCDQASSFFVKSDVFNVTRPNGSVVNVTLQETGARTEELEDEEGWTLILETVAQELIPNG